MIEKYLAAGGYRATFVHQDWTDRLSFEEGNEPLSGPSLLQEVALPRPIQILHDHEEGLQ
jgi:hypothetical protein